MRRLISLPIVVLSLAAASCSPLAAATGGSQGFADSNIVAQGYGAYDDPSLRPGEFGPAPLPAGLGRPPVGLPSFLVPPPPCIRPIIIQVGRGLINKARTRIVYGTRPLCG